MAAVDDVRDVPHYNLKFELSVLFGPELSIFGAKEEALRILRSVEDDVARSFLTHLHRAKIEEYYPLGDDKFREVLSSDQIEEMLADRRRSETPATDRDRGLF